MLKGLRQRKVEARRKEALSEIREQQVSYETMVRRARFNGSVPNEEVNNILSRFEIIDEKATKAVTQEELDDLVEEAESLAQMRAYLCPPAEILAEGQLSIDMMEEWGIPRTILTNLRELLYPSLKNTTDPKVARSALQAAFKEKDSWWGYTEYYHDQMKKYARILLVAIGVLSLLAIFILFLFPEVAVFGVFVSGASGSCVSVIAKLPGMSLSGEFEVYQRRIFSRIGTGVAASMIGCALLGWGLLPISIQNQTFGDVLNACSGATSSCTGVKILILLGIPMLFGFSERALTSFEGQIFGNSNDSVQTEQRSKRSI